LFKYIIIKSIELSIFRRHFPGDIYSQFASKFKCSRDIRIFGYIRNSLQ